LERLIMKIVTTRDDQNTRHIVLTGVSVRHTLCGLYALEATEVTLPLPVNCDECRTQNGAYVRAQQPKKGPESHGTPCACRDCMDVCVTASQGGWTLCELCLDAGCTPYPVGQGDWPGRRPAGEYECQRDDAYGEASEQEEYCRYCSEKISDEDPCPYHTEN
jgi:hypothetical protein